MKQIYLVNLPFDCSNDDVYYLASDFGEVINVEMKM